MYLLLQVTLTLGWGRETTLATTENGEGAIPWGGERRQFPLLNQLGGLKECPELPAGSGAPKTDLSHFHASQNASRRDV